MRLSLSEIQQALGPGRKNGRWHMFYCPVHPDGSKHGGRGGESLGFSVETGILRCFNGCDTKQVADEIRRLLGSGRSLPAPAPRQPVRAERVMKAVQRSEEKWQKVREYSYVSPANGREVGRKLRFERPCPSSPKGKEKRFVWVTPDGMKLTDAGLTVADMPLYRADRIAQTGFADPVWIVEGEKCVEALEQAGQIATCLAGGASQKDFGSALDVLFGRTVYLWPDNDREGREFARRLKSALLELDCNVITISAPVRPGQDAADYLAAGGSIDDLIAGRITQTTVEVHGPDHIIVKVPASPHPVTFEFEAITRGRGELNSELSVSLPGESDYWVRINAMSTTARESLVRSLKSFFDVDVDPPWATLVANAMKALREAYMRSGPVELLEGRPEATPAQFIVDGLIVEKGGTILFGPPGKGKSQLCLALAVSVDAGIDTVFPVRYPAPALYINLERSAESMAARLARVNRALGLPEQRPLPFLNARGKGLLDIIERVREAVSALGIGMVVLDSISRAGLGDLNDNRTANGIVDLLNSLGVAWIGIGHTPRSDTTHLYGSVHQEAGADIVASLETEPFGLNGLKLALAIQKSNDFRMRGAMEFEMRFGPDGLKEIAATSLVEVDDPYAVIRNLLRRGKLTVDAIARETGLPEVIIRATLGRKGFIEVEPGVWGISATPRVRTSFGSWDERLERCYYCTGETVEFQHGVPLCQRHLRKSG